MSASLTASVDRATELVDPSRTANANVEAPHRVALDAVGLGARRESPTPLQLSALDTSSPWGSASLVKPVSSARTGSVDDEPSRAHHYASSVFVDLHHRKRDPVPRQNRCRP